MKYFLEYRGLPHLGLVGYDSWSNPLPASVWCRRPWWGIDPGGYLVAHHD